MRGEMRMPTVPAVLPDMEAVSWCLLFVGKAVHSLLPPQQLPQRRDGFV